MSEFRKSGTERSDLEVDEGTLSVDTTNDRIGIGTKIPGTQLQIEGSEPYVTLKNNTAENTDGGCESKIIFEDHANATLAQIQGSHDGSSDDTKGDLIFSTNNGSSATEALRIDSSQMVTFASQKSPSIPKGSAAVGTSSSSQQSALTDTDSFDGKRAGQVTITLSGGHSVAAGAANVVTVVADQVTTSDLVLVSPVAQSAGLGISAIIMGTQAGQFLVACSNEDPSTAWNAASTFTFNWVIM